MFRQQSAEDKQRTLELLEGRYPRYFHSSLKEREVVVRAGQTMHHNSRGWE